MSISTKLLSKLFNLILALSLIFFINPAFAIKSQVRMVFITATPSIRSDLLKNIAPIVEQSIAAGYYPGAIVLAGHKGRLIYKGVFGMRRLFPTPAPMRDNTIFDIASLTKVIATTPAIMQLIEAGKLSLDAKVGQYWPAFATHGKEQITIRELLTHTSGLTDGNFLAKASASNAFSTIEQLSVTHTPGQQFIYSDVNFVVLAHLVEMITHEPFDIYTQTHIFQPLKMQHTRFQPPKGWITKIAPTELDHQTLKWGIAQDPIARMFGGVSGNAGLFSTAQDIRLFIECLLNNGRIFEAKKRHANHYLLSPLTITKMVTPQTPSYVTEARALGWDIDSTYSNRGTLFPVHSYGHTGYTGTSIWIDPTTKTWLIILTSRLHPKPTAFNALVKDRREIANIIAASMTDIQAFSMLNTSNGEIRRAYQNKNLKSA